MLTEPLVESIHAPEAESNQGNCDLSDVIRLHGLPTVPAVAVRLVQSFANPETPIQEIVELLESDPALAVKIVRAANSVQYSTGRPVTSVDRAAMLLGRKVVTSLALTFSFAESSLESGAAREDYRDYWRQSVVQSTAMAVIAERYAPADAADYQITGLLLDIGRLALLSTMEEQYLLLLDDARRMHRPLHSMEKQQLGTTHAALSAQFLKEWELPEHIVTAAKYHHYIESPAALADDEAGRPILAAAMVASCIGDYFCATSRGLALLRLHEVVEESFGGDSSHAETLIHAVRRRVDESSDLFNADVNELFSPLELMSLALHQLSDIALADSQAPEGASRGGLLHPVDQNRLARITMGAPIDAVTSVYEWSYIEERFNDAFADRMPKHDEIGLLLVQVGGPDEWPGAADGAHEDRLGRVARCLQATLRPTDVIGRDDDNTFAVLVYNAHYDGMDRVAERLKDRLLADPELVAGTPLDVPITIGAAVGRPKTSAAEALKKFRDGCREALAKSKNIGSGSVSTTQLQ